MYALLNTMNARRNEYPGSILSRHRSIAAAVAADKKMQRSVKAGSGQSSYLPTTIMRLSGRDNLSDLTIDEIAEMENAAC